MNQFVAWTALEAEGFGANLQVSCFVRTRKLAPADVKPTFTQHYSNLIETQVREAWKLPATWSLKSQLVFGTPTAAPGEKTFLPVEDRVKVYGA